MDSCFSFIIGPVASNTKEKKTKKKEGSRACNGREDISGCNEAARRAGF